MAVASVSSRRNEAPVTTSDANSTSPGSRPCPGLVTRGGARHVDGHVEVQLERLSGLPFGVTDTVPAEKPDAAQLDGVGGHVEAARRVLSRCPAKVGCASDLRPAT